jgi:hypothetical protein
MLLRDEIPGASCPPRDDRPYDTIEDNEDNPGTIPEPPLIEDNP